MLPTRQVAVALMLLSVASAAWGERAPAAAGAAAPVRVVVDWRTGLALHGIDPVAYFVDARPLPGLPAFELTFADAVWRFRNEGNRAAFARDPAVYLPRFGGHDPVAAARGVATPGNPLLWLVHGERLYLFHTPEARTAFRADPRAALAAAEAQWPRLAREPAGR